MTVRLRLLVCDRRIGNPNMLLPRYPHILITHIFEGLARLMRRCASLAAYAPQLP
jgi:hypothetical protein